MRGPRDTARDGAYDGAYVGACDPASDIIADTLPASTEARLECGLSGSAAPSARWCRSVGWPYAESYDMSISELCTAPVAETGRIVSIGDTCSTDSIPASCHESAVPSARETAHYNGESRSSRVCGDSIACRGDVLCSITSSGVSVAGVVENRKLLPGSTCGAAPLRSELALTADYASTSGGPAWLAMPPSLNNGPGT